MSSAISIARERGAGPATPNRLRSALARFDADAADRIVEEALAVRSIERTIDELLLPGVESVEEDGGVAWRWASGWLAAQTRIAPPAHRSDSVLIFDASRAPDADALYAQALELDLRRVGLRTLTVTLDLEPSRLTRAMLAVEPRVVVLTGRRASLDALGRVVFAARRHGGEVAVCDFRGALGDTGASTVPRLADHPLAARDQLLEMLESRPALSPRVRRAAADEAVAL